MDMDEMKKSTLAEEVKAIDRQFRLMESITTEHQYLSYRSVA